MPIRFVAHLRAGCAVGRCGSLQPRRTKRVGSSPIPISGFVRPVLLLSSAAVPCRSPMPQPSSPQPATEKCHPAHLSYGASNPLERRTSPPTGWPRASLSPLVVIVTRSVYELPKAIHPERFLRRVPQSSAHCEQNWLNSLRFCSYVNSYRDFRTLDCNNLCFQWVRHTPQILATDICASFRRPNSSTAGFAAGAYRPAPLPPSPGVLFTRRTSLPFRFLAPLPPCSLQQPPEAVLSSHASNRCIERNAERRAAPERGAFEPGIGGGPSSGNMRAAITNATNRSHCGMAGSRLPEASDSISASYRRVGK
jgi:hypothetical protein